MEEVRVGCDGQGKGKRNGNGDTTEREGRRNEFSLGRGVRNGARRRGGGGVESYKGGVEGVFWEGQEVN